MDVKGMRNRLIVSSAACMAVFSVNAMASDSTFTADSLLPPGSPLSVGVSAMSDTGYEAGIRSSLDIGRNWNTVIGGGVSGRVKGFDRNGDGYMDSPETLDFGVSNRWKYLSDSGLSLKFGISAGQNGSKGGQDGYDSNTYSIHVPTVAGSDPWGSDIVSRYFDGYAGLKVPVGKDGSGYFAMSAEYSYGKKNSCVGSTVYNGAGHSASASFSYHGKIGRSHEVAVGMCGQFDNYDEFMERTVWNIFNSLTQGTDAVYDYGNAGIFGSYSFRYGEKVSADAVLHGLWYSGHGFRLSPEISLGYSPAEGILLRANGARRLRYSIPLAENPGVFMTGKQFVGDYAGQNLEDSWSFGGGIEYHFRFGASRNTCLEFDYSRVQYVSQTITDYEQNNNAIWFYALDGNRSFADIYRVGFTVDPVKRLTVSAGFTYTDAKIELRGKGLTDKPMTSKFNGNVTLEYATADDKWMFGLSASVYGPCRVYDFMERLEDENGNRLYPGGMTPVYPQLDARVTKRFRKMELYVGGENLTDFRQEYQVIGPKGQDGIVNPRAASFDASAVWGPLAGIKVYVGLRFSL